MPSLLHEAIVDLLHDLPATVPTALTAIGALPPATDRTTTAQRMTLVELQPKESRPDLVLTVHDGRSDVVLLVEVQLRIDPTKHFSWPVCVALARRHFGKPARMVVVTPSASVARWARQPIEIGGSDECLRPVVLGPGTVPLITDQHVAVAHPGDAVLSALVHGQSHHAAAAALAGLLAAATLGRQAEVLYTEVILGLVPDSVRLTLEEPMLQGEQPRRESKAADLADWYLAQYYKATAEGRKAGMEQGIEEGIEQGIEQGIQKGIQKGMQQGYAAAAADLGAAQCVRLRQSLRTVLAGRKLATTAAHEAQIDAAPELPQLLHWLEKAALATPADEVFG